MHEQEGSWRLARDCRNLGTPRSITAWMWRLNPHHGAVMELEEYVDSIPQRLGCAGAYEPVPCAACQNGSLDMGVQPTRPAARWARPRADTTRRATLVRAAAQFCDCTAEMEVPALIPWH